MLESVDADKVISLDDLLDFVHVEIFPLKGLNPSFKQRMQLWQERKGVMLNFAKTRHYIFFDIDSKCIRVLPMNFEGGCLPHERMMKVFPDGFDIYQVNIQDVFYSVFTETSHYATNLKAFSFKDLVVNDAPMVGKTFNDSVAALTLKEVIAFLANVNIDSLYECVLLYPPA